MTILVIVRDIIAGALTVAGCAFLVLGTIGLFRLPDAKTRLHTSTIVDTMGGGLIVLGMIIYGGFSPNALRLLFIGFLLYMTGAVNGHAVGRAIYKEPLRNRANVKLAKGKRTDKEIPVV